MFVSAGLLESTQDDALSLQGRLLKDRALKSAGDQRATLFDQAEAAYLRAAGDRRATYPLINAATIAFLNDKPARAEQLARQTIALLDSGDHEPETSYWLSATRAEAELLLGDVGAGRVALERAVASAPAAWEDHAATLRQLRLVLERAGQSTAMLDDLRPPVSLHFSGIIGLSPDDDGARADIAAALDAIRPGFVFGALAAGADIEIAEMAVARGAQLHVVLPGSIAMFRAESVARFGADWAARFDRLIDAADMIDTLPDIDRLSEAAIVLGEEVAMGLAIRRARALASEAVALRVRRASDGASASETEWRRRGLPFHEVTVSRSEARSDQAMAAGERVAILAIDCPIPAGIAPEGVASRPREGFSILQFDRLARAGEFAAALLRTAPAARIGIDYRIVSESDGDAAADVAIWLARAAPAGSVYAACPGALAMDLADPHNRFEAAGEIVTPVGDIPVSLFLPISGN